MTTGHALRERPLFFDATRVAGSESLFAVLHLPQGAEPQRAVVLCHALAEEKLWSHRSYVTLARELAAHGIVVLRPDFRGEGESDREFEETTVSTRVEDVRACVEQMRKLVPSAKTCLLLGHRIGAAVAARSAAQAGVSGLVLWDPILDGREYIMQVLRSYLATQMAVGGKSTKSRDELLADILAGKPLSVDGYTLSAPLVQELVDLEWLRDFPAAMPLGALVLEVAKGEQTAPSAPLADLAARCPGVTCSVVSSPPFFRETKVFHRRADSFSNATLQWLGIAA